MTMTLERALSAPYRPETSTPPAERQLAAHVRALRAAMQMDLGSSRPDRAPYSAHLSFLRRAVTEYTRAMRRLGAYPEKALVVVKSTVRECGPSIPGALSVDDLVREAAQWCIAAYFETSPAPRGG